MNILDVALAGKIAASGGGGGGTDDYNDLLHLPQINGVTLSGDKSSSALGLQSEITSENQLDSDLIDDTNQDNKFVTSTEKNTWNAKQNAIDADHKLNADYVDDSTSTNKFVTASDKEAWNAKQSAIDSDHKLSSSLVSFSAAEAAALSSGIDNTKVAQISTNQTNILYSLQTGVKNLFDIGSADISDRFHSSVTKTDTSITISTETDKTWARVAIPIILEVGTYHVSTLITNRTVDTGTTTRIAMSSNNTGSSQIGGVDITDNGNVDFAFTTPGGTIYLILFANYTNNAYNATFTASDIMICTKAAWDQEPNVFRPFALPNYDLTVREAEDRAALIEQIDAGAKNEFIFGEFNSGGSNPNVSIANNAVTVSGAQPWAKGYRAFRVTKNTTYVLSFRVTNVTAVATPHYRVSLGTDSSSGASYYGVLSCDTTGNYYMVFTPPTDTDIYLVITSNYSDTTVSDTPSITVDNIMVCTEADWKISQNFAPFALPNTDLTRFEAEDRAALAEVVDSGAKNRFDDIGWMNDIEVRNGTKSVSNGAITLTATDTDCYTGFIPSVYPENYNIYVTAGEQIVLTWKYTAGNSQTDDRVYIFKDGESTNFNYANATDEKLIYTVPRNCTFITIRVGVATSGNSATYSNIMICSLSDWTVSKKYVPFEYPDTLSIVYRSVSSGSRTISYKMEKSDFINKFSVPVTSCGTYLISVVSWSTTPTFSLYTVSYSGGVTTYTNITKIAGGDLTITITGDTMSFDTSGKVVIYALK